MIEHSTDSDYFSFTTGAGSVTLNVNVATYGPTLAAQEELFDSNGNLIATAANASTLSQTLTDTLAAGTYYLEVASQGNITVGAGYGQSVGQFTISGTVAASSGTPTFTLSGALSVNEGAVYTLNLSASDPGHSVSSWQIDWGDGNTQTITGDPSSILHTFAVGPNNYTISADGNR